VAFFLIPPGVCEVKDSEIGRISGSTGLAGGATLFWRMADLLFSQASAHVAKVTHSRKGHIGVFP
jgi:hypothetical protein